MPLVPEKIGVDVDDALALCPSSTIAGVRGVQRRQNLRVTVVSLLLFPSHQNPLNIHLCYKGNKFNGLLQNLFSSPNASLCRHLSFPLPTLGLTYAFAHFYPLSFQPQMSHKEMTIHTVLHWGRAIAHAHCERALRMASLERMAGTSDICANPWCLWYSNKVSCKVSCNALGDTKWHLRSLAKLTVHRYFSIPFCRQFEYPIQSSR